MPEQVMIGHELRRARLARGDTLDEVARLIGCTARSVILWEQGAHAPKGANRRAVERYIAETEHVGDAT